MNFDPYKILGVSKTSSDDEIKKAYRKLALKYHPDKGEGKDTEQKFKEATAAYEVLGDKQKRQQFDQFGTVGGPGGAGPGGFDFSDFGNIKFDFGGGFGDIFDSFFGGGSRRAKRGGPQRGNDIEIILRLTFEEAVFGTVKEVEIGRYEQCGHCKGMGNEPGSRIITCEECNGTGQQTRIQRTPLGQIQTSSICGKCHGEGQIPEKKCRVCGGEGRIVKEQNIKIKVPAGIHDKTAIRLTGKGEAGLKGGPTGDLFAHISITPSKEFKRMGNDIHTEKNIHLIQAVLGDEVEIATINGKAALKIPAGTENGKIFRLKGSGVQKVGTDTKGDHFIKIIVNIPQKISKKEKNLYEELAKEAKLDIKPQSKGLFG